MDIKEWQKVLQELSASENLINLKNKLNNKERIEACYSDKLIYDTLNQWITDCSKFFKFQKDIKKAKDYRIKGNNFYFDGDLDNSILCYSKAINYAPIGSEELELSFGNRSAILFACRHYQECISDIECATLNDGETTARVVKLFVRKGKALRKIKRIDESLEAFKFAESKLLALTVQEQGKLQNLRAEIKKGLCKLKLPSYINKEIIQFDKDNEFKSFLENFKSNVEFPNASDQLMLKNNQAKGRYVVARKDINAGEVIFIEKPFAFVILPQYAHDRCQTCCKEVICPYPCKYCASVYFCNKTCRELGWIKFHQWECGLGLELCYMIGIAHLGFRIAIVGHATELDNEEYKRVQNLVNHIESLDQDDLYQYTITATLLTIYLEKFTNIYNKGDDDNNNRSKLLMEMGASILEHLTQMVCNGHAITDILTSYDSAADKLLNEEQVRIATAIYPSASMMNHSCDPMIINGFENQYLIVRTTKPLKKENEIYNCYGPDFRKMHRDQRRSELFQQYRFWCNCIRCKQDIDFIERFTSYLCTNTTCNNLILKDEANCSKCLKKIPESCLKSVKNAREIMESAKLNEHDQDYKKAIELGKNALKIFTKYLYKHHKDILECKDFLAKMFSIQGQYYDSYKYIEENIKGNMERYGDESIELAHEITKLVEIGQKLIHHRGVDRKPEAELRKINKQIHKYISQGMDIYKLYYGECNNKYLHLLDLGDMLI